MLFLAVEGTLLELLPAQDAHSAETLNIFDKEVHSLYNLGEIHASSLLLRIPQRDVTVLRTGAVLLLGQEYHCSLDIILEYSGK